MKVKYKSKRSFSFGHPGSDVEFVMNELYDTLPEGVSESDFIKIETEAKKPKEKKEESGK